MISFLAFVFVFGMLVFIHELGHFLLAKKNGVQIEKFSFGFGRRLWGRQIGETEYLVSAIPLGGYIKMAGDEPDQKRLASPRDFLSKSCGQRAQIIAAGPILNYLLAFLLFFIIFMVGAPVMTTKVGEVLLDYPAQEAGIQSGDIILTVDGQPVEYWDDMAGMIHQKNSDQPVRLSLERAQQVIEIDLIPRIEEHKNILGQNAKVALIGISPEGEVRLLKYGPGRSFIEGGKKLFELTSLTFQSLWLVITQRLSFQESFAGPILIFKLTGSAARMGFVYLLNLMAVLSMSLAIFNFLPIPVLDGGHLFFLGLEKIRKRPVAAKAQAIATQVGVVLIVTLFIFVSYFDILRSGWVEKASQLMNNTEQAEQ